MKNTAGQNGKKSSCVTIVLLFNWSVWPFLNPRETVSHSAWALLSLCLFLQPHSAVRLVPLRAAPCFHILSAPALQSAVVGGAAQPIQFVCVCTRWNGFFSLYATLAIILVCVFKCSEKLPFGVCVLRKGDNLSVGIWTAAVFSLV